MIEASSGVCTPFWQQPGHHSWIRPPGAPTLTQVGNGADHVTPHSMDASNDNPKCGAPGKFSSVADIGSGTTRLLNCHIRETGDRSRTQRTARVT